MSPERFYRHAWSISNTSLSTHHRIKLSMPILKRDLFIYAYWPLSPMSFWFCLHENTKETCMWLGILQCLQTILLTKIAKRCSFENASSTGICLSSCCNLDKKSTTTFSLSCLSSIVISNSCNNSNYLITLPITTNLFIKNCIVEWSVWTKTL